MDLDAPIVILADYLSEHFPWLASHPALVALLVVCVPVILFILAQHWLSKRRRMNRLP